MDVEQRRLLLETNERMLRAGTGAQLVDDICSSGMADALLDDVDAWSAALEQQGRLVAMSPLRDLVVLRELYTDAGCRLAPPPPGSDSSARLVTDGKLAVDALVCGADESRRVLVVFDERHAWTVTLDELDETPVSGLDAELGLRRVRGSALATPAPVVPQQLHARLRIALGLELVGVCAGALQVALEHTTSRHQFGRPIATFQVVAHRLSQAYVELTAARDLLRAVASDSSELAAVAASSLAGDAALTCLAAAQQVSGAMGFTAEFGLHRHVRRGHALDALLGGAENGPERIASLVHDGGVPRLTSL